MLRWQDPAGAAATKGLLQTALGHKERPETASTTEGTPVAPATKTERPLGRKAVHGKEFLQERRDLLYTNPSKNRKNLRAQRRPERRIGKQREYTHQSRDAWPRWGPSQRPRPWTDVPPHFCMLLSNLAQSALHMKRQLLQGNMWAHDASQTLWSNSTERSFLQADTANRSCPRKDLRSSKVFQALQKRPKLTPRSGDTVQGQGKFWGACGKTKIPFSRVAASHLALPGC